MDQTFKLNPVEHASPVIVTFSEAMRSDGKPITMSEKSIVEGVYERTGANALARAIIVAKDRVLDLLGAIETNTTVLRGLGFNLSDDTLGVVRGGFADRLITRELEKARQSAPKPSQQLPVAAQSTAIGPAPLRIERSKGSSESRI